MFAFGGNNNIVQRNFIAFPGTFQECSWNVPRTFQNSQQSIFLERPCSCEFDEHLFVGNKFRIDDLRRVKDFFINFGICETLKSSASF